MNSSRKHKFYLFCAKIWHCPINQVNSVKKIDNMNSNPVIEVFTRRKNNNSFQIQTWATSIYWLNDEQKQKIRV